MDDRSLGANVLLAAERFPGNQFCVLEREGAKVGLGGPSLVLIAGKDKAHRTVLSKQDYDEVRALGREYRAQSPRSVLV